MADKTTLSNPWLDAWLAGQQQFLKAQQPLFAAMSGGENMPQSMERAQANWALLEKQAADWLKASGRWMRPEATAAAQGEGIASETLRRMLDPTQFLYAGMDEINHAIQRLVEGPEFADIGTLERQMLKTTAEWLALRGASASYRAVIGSAWSRAFDTFSKETASNPKAFAGGSKAMLDHWLAVANEELTRTQRTDEFLDAQRKLLRAGVDYRLKERELVEIWCETHSIPTRTEVDDLHRTVHELRRQVRALTKGRGAATSSREGGDARTKKTAERKPAAKTAPKTPRNKASAKTTTKAAPKRAPRKPAGGGR
jgi:polyhydroxyalkanoate synthesis regulator phasin